MSFKKFDCMDKEYLSKKERKTYTISYSLVMISIIFLSVILKIDYLITIGIILIQGVVATIILYLICRNRIKKYGNRC